MTESDGEVFQRIGRPPEARRKRRSRRALLPVLVGLLVLVLLGVGGLAVWLVLDRGLGFVAAEVAAVTDSPLEVAQKKCAPGSPYARIGDSGKTLILQSAGEKKSGLRWSEVSCLLAELRMSDAVRSEMEATRALDGRRSGSWDGFHAAWSYHPDSGMSMTVTLAD